MATNTKPVVAVKSLCKLEGKGRREKRCSQRFAFWTLSTAAAPPWPMLAGRVCSLSPYSSTVGQDVQSASQSSKKNQKTKTSPSEVSCGLEVCDRRRSRTDSRSQPLVDGLTHRQWSSTPVGDNCNDMSLKVPSENQRIRAVWMSTTSSRLETWVLTDTCIERENPHRFVDSGQLMKMMSRWKHQRLDYSFMVLKSLDRLCR